MSDLVFVNGVLQSPSDYTIVNDNVTFNFPVTAADVINIKSTRPFMHRVVDSEIVDNEPWHTIMCNAEISAWLRTHNCYEHPGGQQKFDLSEKLYSIVCLKWPI